MERCRSRRLAENQLFDLAAERALRDFGSPLGQKRFCHLLGDRASALNDVTRAEVGDARADDRGDVDPGVLEELVILGGDKRLDDNLRDLFVRNDVATLLVELANLLVLALFVLGDNPSDGERLIIGDVDDFRKIVGEVPENSATDHGKTQSRRDRPEEKKLDDTASHLVFHLIFRTFWRGSLHSFCTSFLISSM